GNTNSIVAEQRSSHTTQAMGGPQGQGVSVTNTLSESTNSIQKSAIVNEQKENWGSN
ncbi:MAG: hypothetical protein HQL15_10270, partial [Candidatus Omnitrophica bacterium]|nr:hypothetical protein [Candidatus Omnitrophota bacterium]